MGFINLKDYLLKGYALNEKRLKVLNRVVEIQSNILAIGSNNTFTCRI